MTLMKHKTMGFGWVVKNRYSKLLFNSVNGPAYESRYVEVEKVDLEECNVLTAHQLARMLLSSKDQPVFVDSVNGPEGVKIFTQDNIMAEEEKLTLLLSDSFGAD